MGNRPLGNSSRQRKKKPSDAAEGNRWVVMVEWISNQRHRLVDSGRDVIELGAGVGADRADCGQANDNDQGQHDCVFNCSRAIF